MNAEERVMTLLAWANPEPDEGFDIESDAPAYLATLHKRSSEMTQLETRTGTTAKSKPRLRWAFAGGVAALAVAVAFVILMTGDSKEVAGGEDLVSADFHGTWTVPLEGISALFLYFDEDGRYALSDSFGEFEARTIETGTWTYDGQEFVFITDDSSTTCAGTTGRYQAHRLDDERILLTPVVPDPCADRQRGNGLGAIRSYPLDPAFSGR